MQILSWNINGLRAVIKKGFLEFLEKERPDVLCLQEIKISESARTKELGSILDPKNTGYDVFWNSAKRPGYSGTATLVRTAIAKTLRPDVLLPSFEQDDEGRVQIIDLGGFYLVNVYFPNANHELSRLKFKIDFNDRLLMHLKELEKSKPLVITGDFNVAHNEIDLARPKENVGRPGFTDEEREWMTKFLHQGFIDTFRSHHPQKAQYSWWSFRAGARKRNVGWRIDYFCVSESIGKKIKKAFIKDEIEGSDHCPVGIEIL